MLLITASLLVDTRSSSGPTLSLERQSAFTYGQKMRIGEAHHCKLGGGGEIPFTFSLLALFPT